MTTEHPRAEGGRMNAEIELKSCPFCGAGDGFVGLSYVVGCSNCGAEGPKGDTDDETVAAWNTRPAPTEAEVEAAARRIEDAFLADGVRLTQSQKQFAARAALGVGHE